MWSFELLRGQYKKCRPNDVLWKSFLYSIFKSFIWVVIAINKNTFQVFNDAITSLNINDIIDCKYHLLTLTNCYFEIHVLQVNNLFFYGTLIYYSLLNILERGESISFFITLFNHNRWKLVEVCSWIARNSSSNIMLLFFSSMFWQQL